MSIGLLAIYIEFRICTLIHKTLLTDTSRTVGIAYISLSK